MSGDDDKTFGDKHTMHVSGTIGGGRAMTIGRLHLRWADDALAVETDGTVRCRIERIRHGGFLLHAPLGPHQWFARPLAVGGAMTAEDRVGGYTLTCDDDGTLHMHLNVGPTITITPIDETTARAEVAVGDVAGPFPAFEPIALVVTGPGGDYRREYTPALPSARPAAAKTSTDANTDTNTTRAHHGATAATI